ncbi:hypothetical protein Tco_1002494 [Tanacetum coccineum]|uniref:Uncharacterized protein n=1 Tax=Tanacetum coccineum TaxID=301880 RepID=A0ABQ5F6J0_9ASTR
MQESKDTITSSDTVALKEFDQITTLFNTITKSNSFNKIPKHIALYHALMESILEDEDAMDKGVADELKKRKPDDADKDECPSAGSNRGLKRQRTSKGNETSKKTSATKDSFKGKSPATSSKSSKSGKSAKDQVVEPIFVQDSDNVEHDVADYANMSMDQGEDLVNTYEQPNDEIVPKNDWYKKSSSDTSPDPEWNKGKLVDDGLEQSWLNDMAATKPPLTFDKLMHTPIDFSAFAMNRLKIENLIKELLVGPVYNLLKGTCKIYVELNYTMEECYRALSEQLDWNNPEGHQYLRGGSNDKKYTASTTKSKAARYKLKGIEDMLGVESYQKKLNLTKPRTQDVDMSRRPAYTTLSNPQGVMCEDNLKRKRFMRADEFHKFCNDTLISVRETLDQMLHELHVGYNTAMRKRLWTSLDHQRACIIIKAINQKLLDR